MAFLGHVFSPTSQVQNSANLSVWRADILFSIFNVYAGVGRVGH